MKTQLQSFIGIIHDNNLFLQKESISDALD